MLSKLTVFIFIFSYWFSTTKSTNVLTVSTTTSPNVETQENCEKKFENRLQIIETRLSHMQRALDDEKNINKELSKKLQELKNSVNHEFWPKSCQVIKQKQNSISGTYIIKPKSKIFEVFCDMGTKGGGWTVVQNRFDGSQDFFLDWVDYKNGFGRFSGEFWLGLEHLHELTGDIDNELLVELTDIDNKTVYAEYEKFRIGNEKGGYTLKVLSGYKGDAGDCLHYHVGMKFSTRDRDQDENQRVHCAHEYKGAWWYNSCYWSHLNGKYQPGELLPEDAQKAIIWRTFRPENYGLLRSRMMIRPSKFH